jgi:hypothetical protein
MRQMQWKCSKNLTLRWIGFGFLIMVLVESCSQDDLCIEPSIVNMQTRFQRADTNKTFRDTLLANANLYFGVDQKYFVNSKKRAVNSFPLSQADDSVRIIFQSDSNSIVAETIDTLDLYYTRNLNFISSACGYQTYYTLQKVIYTEHIIDSIYFKNKEITSKATDNLNIVIR